MATETTLRDLIDGIETVRATLTDESRAAAIERLSKRGKLSARTRLDRLVDSGTFDEIGGLVAAEEDGIGAGPARTRSPADGVVVGTARIDGRPVVVFSQDFSVFGGSIGRLGSAKIQRALRLAIDRGVPLIMILDGGGHRSQDGQDHEHDDDDPSQHHGTWLGSHLPVRLPLSRKGLDPAIGVAAPPGQRCRPEITSRPP